MSKNHLRCETTLGPLCGADGRVIRYSRANVTCRRCRAIAEKTPKIDAPRSESSDWLASRIHQRINATA